MKTKHRSLLPLAAFAGLAAVASPAVAVTVTNPNFDPPAEDTSDNTGIGGIGPISGWSNTGTVGVTNTTPFLNQSAHSGTHVAFTRAAASITQSVSGFDPSKQYTVTYFVSERGVGGLGEQSTAVSLDGGTTSYTQSDPIQQTDAFRRIVSGPLPVSGATSSLQISALDAGDRTLLIDSVSISRAVPTVPDGGFENPVQPSGQYKQATGTGGGDLTGSAWTFAGGGGITDNGSAFAPPAAPEGSQAAILQGETAEFSTTVSGFEARVTYSLSFEAAGRSTGAADFQVSLGGTLLQFGGSDTLTPDVGSYATFTSDGFTTSGGSLTLKFDGTAVGNSFVDDIRFNFVAEATADTFAPEIVAKNPSGDTPAAPVDSDLVLIFDEPITLKNDGTITIKNLTATTETVITIPDDRVSSPNGNDVLIDPDGDLASGANFAIRISSDAVEDQATMSNAFDGIDDDTTWNFTTAVPDTDPPVISSLRPADAAAGVPPFASLKVTFDENIAAGTGSILIKNLTDSTTTSIDVDDAQVSIAGQVLTINPTADLLGGKDYAVRIPDGAIVDLVAPTPNAFGGITDDTTWNFTVGSFAPIYSDDFSGDGTANLFGTTPDIATAHNGVAAGSTWSGSDAAFKDDGSIVVDGSRGVWLPFVPATGNIYILSGSIDNGGGASWLTLGFAENNPDNHFNSAGAGGANSYGTVLITNGADGSTFDGVVLNGGPAGIPISTGVNDIDIVLDARDAASANWTVEYFVGTVSVGGPNTAGSGSFANINHAGFSCNNTDGTISDFELFVSVGEDTFADWITLYPGVGGQTGLDQDPDGDGNDNGVENYFGTDPSAFSQGLVSGTVDAGAGTFTFTHPQGTLASDLTAGYRWSKDLLTFHADGDTDGAGTKVDFTPSVDDPVAGTTTVSATVSGTATDKLFLRIGVDQILPLLSEDFEGDDGGFTIAVPNKGTGTEWTHGVPNSLDQGGGAVTAGNGGSAKCWGTNLTGGYAADTDACLRSSVIDLTGVTGATLSFALSLDADAGHTYEVNVIEAATDTVIANVLPATGDASPASSWITMPGIAIPGAVIGQMVRLEWRFTGDGNGSYNGAYLDDVEVTQ